MHDRDLCDDPYNGKIDLFSCYIIKCSYVECGGDKMTAAIMDKKNRAVLRNSAQKKSAGERRHNQELNDIIDKSWKEAIRGLRFSKIRPAS